MSRITARLQKRFNTSENPLLRVGILSLMVNLSLVGIKVALAAITGSLALQAESIHSTVDVFASIAVITGLLISTRKSKKFPYGLYKVENIVSLIISVLLFVATYEIVREALTGASTAADYGGWVLVVVGGLVLIPFFFSRYEKKLGEKYNSPSLIADASQFKADVLSASVVFFAVAGQYFGFPLDKYAAVIVAIFIGLAGWELLSGSVRVILDASVSQETLAQIRAVILDEPAVVELKEVTGRNSGRYIFVEAVLSLRLTDLEKAHFTCQRIEESIKTKVENIDRILIHYEPPETTTRRYVIALDADGETISNHFGESTDFVLLDIDTRNQQVLRRENIANPFIALDRGKGIKVAELLLAQKPDHVVVAERLEHKGPGYAFADAGVEIIQTGSIKVDEYIANITAGRTGETQ